MSSLSATQPASVPHSMPVAIAPTPLSFLVVILDPSVKDLSMLMAHVVPEATVFLLEGDRDGIQQITEILHLHPHLTQVHLISHGSPGCLYLGNTELSLATLDRYTPQLQTWFTASPPRSIAPPSHILLYGCQVAAGDAGAEFIDGLKRLTGADITASQTLTGSAALGGDWNLDKTTCDTPVTLAFHAEGLKDYPFVLPVFNNLYYGLFSIDGGSTFRELRTVNLSTGASTAVTGTSSTLFDSAAMSRDAIAGRIYYIERVSSNARVAYYDTLTGTHTLVGTTGAANTFIRMATAADGTIWASGTNNELYSINPGTGQATLRYTMGFTAAVASGDMAFDPNNANVLYVTRGATTIELYRIVLNTANYSSSTTTLVGDTGQSGSGSGAMAFGNDGKLYSSSNSNLIEINTITAAASIVATAIGSVGDFTSLPIPQANPANAPTPTTDSYTITTNSSINLLAAPNSIFANDSDPNGDPLTLLSVTQASNGTVTLNNNQTPFNSNDDTLIYTPNANFSGIDSFTYTVGDGKGGYNVSTVNIKVNAPPVLDLDQNNSTTAGNNYQATFTEGGSAVSIADSDIVITDANDTNLESATIVLTNAQIDDVLAIGTLPAGINSTIDTSVAGQITITLTGSASKTDYGTAIRAITFSNTSSNPITTNRTLNITVNDGDITSNITTTTMAVQAVNAPPVVDLNGSNDVGNNYSTTFTEGGSPVAIADTDLLISDADGTDINTLTLSVSSIPDAANEVLNIGGQTIVLTNGTGVTTVGGTSLAIAANNGAVSITRQGGGDIPSADLQTLLQGITYQNNSTTPTTINRIITVKANDGTADSNLATSTITIDANQSPVIDLNGSSTSLDEVVNNLLVPTGDALAAPPKSAWEVLLYAGHFGVAGAPNQGTGNDQLSQNGFGLDGGTPQLHAQSFIGQGLNSYTFTTRLGGTTSFSSSTDPVTRAATASGITFINNSANGAYAPSTYGNSGIWSYVLRRDVTEPTTITIGEAGDWFDDYGELFVNGVRINPAILSFTSNLPASSILQATVQPGDRVEVRLTNIGGPGGFHVEFSSPGLIPDANFANSFTEGSAPIRLVDTDGDVSDTGENDITQLNITPNQLLDGAFETLVLTDSNSTVQTIALSTPLSAPLTAVFGGTTFSIGYNGAHLTITNQSGATTPMAQADLDALIRSLTYQNTSENPTAGNRTFTFSLTDSANQSSNPAIATITVTPVNDPPLIDLNGSNDAGNDYSGTFTENGAPVKIVDTDAIATDVDGTDIETLTLTFNAIPDGTNEVLTIGGQAILLTNGTGTTTVGGTTFAIAANNGTVTLTRQGGGNIANADIQTLLQSVTYQNNSDSPTGSSRIITIKANDGIAESNLASSTITIQPTNDPPAVDLNGNGAGTNFTVSFLENTAATPITDPTATLFDLDGTDINTVTLNISGLLDGASEILQIGGQAIPLVNGSSGTATVGGTVFAIAGTNSTVTLTKQGGGDIPNADIQTLLRGITYQNNSEDPSGGDRIITVLANDGNIDSNLATSTITVTAINDAPVLDLDANDSSGATTSDYTNRFTRGTPVTIGDTDTLITDADDTLIESATIQLTTKPNGASESLNLTGAAQAAAIAAGITVGVYNPTTGQLQLTGAASLAAYEMAIAAITYNNTAANPDRSDRIITAIVQDGTSNSNLATVTLRYDTDGDGVVDAIDLDDDNDGVTDTDEMQSNPLRDTDGDGIIDSLDLDSDNDGITDLMESGLSFAEIATLDTNQDGMIDPTYIVGTNGLADVVEVSPDSNSVDYNNDGISDAPVDTDGDGKRDFQDLDADNDGINDVVEAGGADTDGNGLIDGTGTDTNGNGLANSVDPGNGGTPLPIPDTDADGKANFRDLDSDNDGLPDWSEAGLPVTVDQNGDGVVDGTDTDGDGILDRVDGLINGYGDNNGPASNALPNDDGDATPNYLDLDSDGDGTPDRIEAGLPTGTGTPDVNGDGRIDNPADADQDGIPDSIDSQPGLFGGLEDHDGDGILDAFDLDDDNDGITDAHEMQNDPTLDTDGDGIIDSLDLDSDNDGITDLIESGLSFAEIATLDTNQDGVIDPTKSFGINGLANDVEVSPDSGTVDYNKDGTPDQPVDTDGDGKRDFQDLDSDNDGLHDVVEAGGLDTDGNGLIDGAGSDTDGDGLANAVDPSNGGTALPVPDTDTDGQANFRDLDSDNDGLPDLLESGLPTAIDPNGDGVVDGTDTDGDGIKDLVDGLINGYGDSNGSASNTLPNGDGDATPDYLDLDSDGDGTPDRIEAGLPTGTGSPDVNGDGQIDNPVDADQDGIPDSIDSNPGIFGGFEDTDGDGVLNAIDLDDDNDGIPDAIEMQNPTLDTDGDGILDSLDLDSDNDGIPDLMESGLPFAAIASLDTNQDGIIDATYPFGANGLANAIEVAPESGTVDYNQDGTADTPVDTDGDGQRDFQDLDADNDGIHDVTEAGGLDADGNGLIDGVGIDSDGDGLADAVDPSNSGTPLPIPDTDTDGIANFRDLDSDNDGLSDLLEGGLPMAGDRNADGVVDGTDTDGDGIQDLVDGTNGYGDNNGPASNALPNSDGDTVPNYLDLDSDGDGTPDRAEAGLPTGAGTPDANGDGRIDDPVDGDRDGIPDRIDSKPGIFGGFEDHDGDGILDAVDLDDDNDGISDADEMQTNPRLDTDGDDILDSLDLDSDNDGIPDLMESGLSFAEIATLDTNRDGAIDSTQSFGLNGLADAVEVTPDSGTVDYNNNGIADAPVDTDGDGKRDFQDLDTDNDGINDVVEAGGPDTDGDGLIDGAGTDTDGDGLVDAIDPSNGGTPLPIPDTDADGQVNFRDLDSDNDGLPDLLEAGLPPTVDANGDGVVDGSDSDRDGIQDAVDGLTNGYGDNQGSAGNLPNGDGDSLPNYLDLDSDGDTIPDRLEAGLPTGTGTPDANRDGQIDNPMDSDLDGIPDGIDSKPVLFGGFEDHDGDGVIDAIDLDDDNDGITDAAEMQTNPTLDTDGDGIVDSLDLDSDNDGITDLMESGLTFAEIATLDSNQDGAIDSTQAFGANGLANAVEVSPDSGTTDYNNDGTADAPVDTDGDGKRDFQDLDADNDGINDVVEAGGTDADGNGVIDGAGTDTDGDGLANQVDPSQGGTPLPVPDTDSDGKVNFRDLDSDNDGLSDLLEAGLPPAVDLNSDGVVDGTDTDGDGIRDAVDGLLNGYGDNNGPASNALPNTDGDATPNYLDLDSDGDGTPDRTEAGLPTGAGSPDANGDGRIDNPADADHDGIPDGIDSKPGIWGGFEDHDGDGIIDVIDLDDDNDGISDTDEMQTNLNLDTDGDGILDRLDLDSDNDGITDLMESGLSFAEIATLDVNQDGVIDPTNSFGVNGLANAVEVAPDTGTVDYNNDGVADAPVDTDGDSQRDFQDLDADNDGINDVVEAGGTDADGNGVIDGATTDSDKDGLADSVDPGNGGQPLPVPDTDTDGKANFRDLDSDNDGLPDLLEAGLPSTIDTNRDGVVDGTDTDGDGILNPVDGVTNGFGDNNGPSRGNLPNEDGDALPNYLDLDSNGNNIPDRIEAGLPTGAGTPDIDRNGLIDSVLDTDNDGIPDPIDSAPTAFGGFEDTDGDGIPNFYDLDIDNDGISNLDEQNGILNRDTDQDGILDSLDLDSDNDGISDLMESGLSFTEIATLDSDRDGVIDATQPFGSNGLADGVEVTPDSGTVDYNNDGKADSPVDTDGDTVRDFQDLDADNDGINDVVEAGGTDADGNGLIDGTDSNGNGLVDVVDPRGGGSALPIPDTDADNRANFRDLDSDSDGLPDSMEAPFNPDLVDRDRDGVIDGADTDGDGIRDLVDGSVNTFGDGNGPSNTALGNADRDGIPDYLEVDSNNNGIPDRLEAKLPTGLGTPDANTDGILDNLTDTDQDGITDSIDAKPGIFGGFDFTDTDQDGITDSVDLDDDNDGIPDSLEGTGDTDQDGFIDALDLDSDNDGIPDIREAGGTDINQDGLLDNFTDTDRDGLGDRVDANNGGTPLPVFDTDGDGKRDFQDRDSDNDGIMDVIEAGGVDPDGDGIIGIGKLLDSNNDGLPDLIDPAKGGTALPIGNTDGDSVPDYRDLDSDNDGIPDVTEAGGNDPDGNGLIGTGNPIDTDGDGIADTVDLNQGGKPLTPLDLDGDRTPDYRDLDSDNDGIFDLKELGAGLPDIDQNGKLDGGDQDGDGLIDSIDGSTTSFGSNGKPLPLPTDTNGDGIPDYREPPALFGGGSKSDQISGGKGNDILNGFSDLDILNGGDGDDIINGGSDADVIRGESGNDILNGGSNNDDMTGGTGNDVMNGGTGNDLMLGEDDNDLLNGGSGRDTLRGGRGNDILNGNQDNDRLYGDEDNDVLRGDRGNDILVGGAGQDKLTGGQGRDRFTYQSVIDFGDRISDFEIRRDRIDLRAVFQGSSPGSMSKIRLRQSGDDLIVQVNVGGFKTLATLEDVNLDTINARHFIF